jgi:hypothetical protein
MAPLKRVFRGVLVIIVTAILAAVTIYVKK